MATTRESIQTRPTPLSEEMRAVVIRPGGSRETEMIRLPRPVAGPGEVLIAMREVGIDGTDHEVISGEHGDRAPGGADYLVIGHESLGQVAELGDGVNGLREGDWVVCTVRRPDDCSNCRRGEIDMCLWGEYTERGIKGAHGYLAEYVAEQPQFVVPVPADVRPVGALIEPLSIGEKAVEQIWRVQQRLFWEPRRALVFGLGTIGILTAALLRLRGLDTVIYSRDPSDAAPVEVIRQLGISYVSARDVRQISDLCTNLEPVDAIVEATGSAEVVSGALALIRPNVVLCLLSIVGSSKRQALDIAAVNDRVVLDNAVIFGSVNSSRPHFERAIEDLQTLEATWPGFTRKLITRRVPFERFREAFEERDDDIKVLIEVSP